MPRIAASGDDAVVGTKVPFTTADSLKEMGTTQPQKSAPASSSNVCVAGDNGSRALISGTLPKFYVKKLSMKRSSA